jgi:DNA-binding NarL/FixJ family response regulator
MPEGCDASPGEEASALQQRIAVFDRVPIYAHGLVATLRDAGFQPHQNVGPRADGTDGLVDDVSPPSLIVLTLRRPADWDLLRRLGGARTNTPILAVLSDPPPQLYREAIAAGASAVVAEDESLAEIVEAVHALLHQRTVLPATVVRELAARDQRHDLHPLLEPAEIGWLRALASGVTTAALAEQERYSEREMYRLLRKVYEQMGATSRADALVMAARWGLI